MPTRRRSRCPMNDTARMPIRLISGCASAGADHDPEGERQEREAGLERAVAADLLHVDATAK